MPCGTTLYEDCGVRSRTMKHKISVIIPAFNEASIINQTIGNVLGLPYDGEIEIIVIDGSPYSETLSSINEKNILKISGKKGRSLQMNEGSLNAHGEILLFLHADTELPLNALKMISSVMEKGDFVAGAFALGINSSRPAFRLVELGASLRSRLTKIPYGDQAIFIWKDYFEAKGGFKEIPLMEDVELMQRIKKAGDKIHIIPEKVRTSPRRWEKEGVLFCTLRNWALITLYSFGVPPERIVKFYK